ncbi:MAG TPA: DUF4410 domain-containing protein [Geobacteraceae bacterium]
MKRMSSLMLFAFLLAFSPLALADEKPLPKPDVLTEEAIYTAQRLSTYDTLIIRDMKTDGAEYSRVDDEEKVKIEAMKPLLIRTISESLDMELKARKLFKNVLKNEEPKGKAIIFEGAITEFNAGSRALKFFVGFGAGKAYLKVKGRLIDAESGKELAVFEDRETGFKGAMSLESYQDLFPHQAKSLGENIANFMQKLY